MDNRPEHEGGLADAGLAEHQHLQADQALQDLQQGDVGDRLSQTLAPGGNAGESGTERPKNHKMPATIQSLAERSTNATNARQPMHRIAMTTTSIIGEMLRYSPALGTKLHTGGTCCADTVTVWADHQRLPDN